MKKLSPAVRSLLSMALYLVVIIVGWIAVGTLMFPQKPLPERIGDAVVQYRGVLTQVAENVIDPEQWTGVQQAADIGKIYDEIGIFAAFEDEDGVAFALKGRGVSKEGYDYILYRPSGEYRFRHEGGFVREDDSDGSARWVIPGSKSYVRVWKLEDDFYLEEAVVTGE